MTQIVSYNEKNDIQCSQNTTNQQLQQNCTSNSKLFDFNIKVESIPDELINHIDQIMMPLLKLILFPNKINYVSQLKYQKIGKIILANLYNAYVNKDWLRYYRREDFYSHKKKIVIQENQDIFSARLIKRFIDAMIYYDQIEHKIGWYNRNTKKGNLSRCYPKPKLIFLFYNLYQKYETKIDSQPPIYVSDYLLKVNTVKYKITGTKEKISEIIPNILDNVSFPKNIKTKSQKLKFIKDRKDEVQELNDWLNKNEIIIENPRTIRDRKFCFNLSIKRKMLKINNNKFIILEDGKRIQRIFNDADFTKGGRLYGDFQQLNKETRKNLLINNEPVVSIDISQCHLRMLYHMENQDIRNKGDMYQLYYDTTIHSKFRCKVIRNINKTLVQMFLNAKSEDAAIRAGLNAIKDEFNDVGRWDIAHKFNTLEFSQEWMSWFESIHAPIKKYFYKSIGKYLQYLESDLIIRCMLDLKLDDIVSLPIHDELIVPVSAKDNAIETMKYNYKSMPEFNGYEVLVDIEHAPHIILN